MEHRCVVMEALFPEGWQQVGPGLGPDMPRGSFSDNRGDDRQIFVFGWQDGVPGVWRSGFGVDVEVEMGRWITSTGFVQMADLVTGPYEMNVRHPTGRNLAVRFRLADRA